MSFFFTTFHLTLKKYFFSKKTNTILIFSIFLFFIQNKTSSYFEKETDWKTIFLYFFFRNSKHIFLTSKKEFFSKSNDVIKFINTKTEKLFFNFLYRKPQHTHICFIINLQKKYENRGVSSRVLNSGNFVKGMVLPKADSLSSLHAWF